jgi:hypothetical protein
MQGVFLAAAELTRRGFVVSLTARNAFGADLLVTNQCQHAWSVQVKTNQSTSANFWLLSAHCEKLRSKSHVYVFVALKGKDRPSFLVVPSLIVAENVKKQPTKGGEMYWFDRNTEWPHEGEGWEECFGSPGRILEPENPSPPLPKPEELGARDQHTAQHD